MTDHADERELARETKAIVALAFRNGPIEDVHAGQLCPTCTGKPGYSRVSDAEMKLIMKNAVNRVYVLLWLKVADPDRYAREIAFGEHCTAKWDAGSSQVNDIVPVQVNSALCGHCRPRFQLSRTGSTGKLNAALMPAWFRRLPPKSARRWSSGSPEAANP